MAWDADAQRLYVASPSGSIWSFPRAGSPQRLTTSLARISLFALDGSGRRLFATDTRRGRVLFLDLNAPATGLLALADDSPLAGPWSVVYDSGSARLFVADEHRDSVFVVNAPAPPNRPLSKRWAQFAGPNAPSSRKTISETPSPSPFISSACGSRTNKPGSSSPSI